MAMLQKYLANMTYEHIEKDYWETFNINQSTDKINGYPVIKISDTYSRPATVEDFESFLKQSFIKYLQSEVERLENSKKKELPEDQYMLLDRQEREDYNQDVTGYNQAISDQITHLQAQIKELEEK